MNFFIKKNSTLPVLKYPLTQKVMEKNDITDDMMENVAVTFSMSDPLTGLFKIANLGADLIISNDRDAELNEVKYTLAYHFTVANTSKKGHYIGEFKLDFLGDDCGKITLPVNDIINIFIDDSLSKTEVF